MTLVKKYVKGVMKKEEPDPGQGCSVGQSGARWDVVSWFMVRGLGFIDSVNENY